MVTNIFSGTPLITRAEPISLSGPASYLAGGFTATFPNIPTVQRAIICLVSGVSTFLFLVTAKSGNQVTLRAFRALKSHGHTFTPVAHGHTFTPVAHSHTFTPVSHTHTFTPVAHGHSFVATAAGGTLVLGMAVAGVHIPIGNPTRTVPAGSPTAVQDASATGTVVGASATGTLDSVAAGGSNALTAATGTVVAASSDDLEEITPGTNLSGVTLELLGFGS